MKHNNNKIPIILGTLGLCVVGETLIGFLQSFLHLDEISTWQDTSGLNPEDVISRVYGTLKPLNPNLFGGYLVCGLPVLIGSVFYFLNRKQFKIALGSLIGGLCTGAGVGLLVLFKQNKNLKQNFYILLLLYSVGALFGVLLQYIL